MEDYSINGLSVEDYVGEQQEIIDMWEEYTIEMEQDNECERKDTE